MMASIKNVNKILDQFDFFSTPEPTRRKTMVAAVAAAAKNPDRPPLASANRAPGGRATYVEDTPSPNKGKKARSMIAPNPRPVVHATPHHLAPAAAAAASKKTKKLFDEDAHLRRGLEDANDKTVDDDEEDEEAQVSALVLNPNTAKVSHYFKPKASAAADKENESSREECDLSFNSLKKRERKRMRNPYVIRFSDVFTSKEIQKLVGGADAAAESTAGSLDQQHEHEHESEDAIPSPERLLLVSAEVDAENAASSKSARFKTSLFYSNMTSRDDDDQSASFTKVTRQMTDEDEAATGQQEPSPARIVSQRRSKSATACPVVKRLSSSEVIVSDQHTAAAAAVVRRRSQNLTSPAVDLNESEIDRILHFNCRRPVATDRPRVSYHLTTGHSKLTKSGSVDQLARWRRPCDDTGGRRQSLTKKKKKRFHLACLELTSGQLDAVTKCLDTLNGSTAAAAPDTRVHASLKTRLSKVTTHVLVDFDSLFGDSHPTLKVKCQLLLATLARCKVVRYEWLLFSHKKGAWLGESKFTLDKYIDQECEYDEQDFDLRLLRLTKRLEQAHLDTLFKACKNVYVISERRTDELMEGEDEEDEEEDDSFLSVGDSLADLLNELVRRCGGHVTSRLKLAERIVAIDKLGNLDEEDEEDEAEAAEMRQEIKLEQKYFADRVIEIQQVHRHKPHVQVLSSDWIIDCVLEAELLDVARYVLVDIHPNAITSPAIQD